jgi:hypothetical protein
MRVIEEKRWTSKMKCPSCGSVLEIDESDVRYGDFALNIGRGNDYQFYARCERGECGEVIQLEDRSVPEHVQRRARRASGR